MVEENNDKEARRLGRRMIILGWLAQNASSGLAFGVFGTTLVALEQRYHVERSLSALGIPLLLLALAIGAPIIGTFVHRIGTRVLMTAGAALFSAGYVVLMLAPNIYVVLAGYAFLIGPGYALLGAMLPSTLISHWFEKGRGRALGIINMPALLAIVPLIATRMLGVGGLYMVYGAAALFMAALVPAMLMIVDKPSDRGLMPVGASAVGGGEALPPPIGYGVLAAQPAYWTVVIMGCILGGDGVVVSSHIVAMGIGWGFDPLAAAALLTAVGGFGIAGAPLFGWLSDKFGGVPALTLNAGFQGLLWIGLLFHPSYPVTLAIACGFGIGSGGMTSTFYATLSERFGPRNFSRAYGLFGITNLPFTVGAPAMAGILYARTGSYQLPFLIVLGALGLTIVLGILLRVSDGRAAPATALPT
jgi:MFS family permease